MKNESSPKIAISCSTDIGGVGGTAEYAISVYEKAGFVVAGAEMVLMPPQKRVVSDAVRFRGDIPPITGVHGRLGSKDLLNHSKGVLDWLLINFVDLVIPGAIEEVSLLSGDVLDYPWKIELLAQRLPGQALYYNVHNDEAANHFRAYLGWALQANYAYLTIENGVNPGDLGQTTALIDQYRDAGASVTGTLDLVHAGVELGDSTDYRSLASHWGTILNFLVDNNDRFRHIHIPIGTNTTDSLPWEEMRKSRWMIKDLVDALVEAKPSVTFENQANLIWGYPSTEKAVDRTKMVYEDLADAGLNV